MAERTVIHKNLMTNETAVETLSTVLGPAFCSKGREWTFYVFFRPGTTAGAVFIETAHDPAFTGTWAQLGTTVTWATANTVHFRSITGTYLAMRARISTAITGGTGVDVSVVGS